MYTAPHVLAVNGLLLVVVGLLFPAGAAAGGRAVSANMDEPWSFERFVGYPIPRDFAALVEIPLPGATGRFRCTFADLGAKTRITSG